MKDIDEAVKDLRGDLSCSTQEVLHRGVLKAGLEERHHTERKIDPVEVREINDRFEGTPSYESETCNIWE